MRTLMRLILILLLVALVSACSSEEPAELPTRVPTIEPTATITPSPTAEPPTATPTQTPIPVQVEAEDPAQQSFVQMTNTVIDSPAIDIYFESLVLAYSLSYRQEVGSTPITGGTYNVTLMPAGERLNGDVPPLMTTTVTIPEGETTTLVILGTPDALEVNTYTAATEPMIGEQARINLIHAIPNAPEVVLIQDGEALTAPIRYGGQSVPIEIAINASSLVIATASDQQALTFYTDALREKNSITLVLTGDAANPESLELIEFNTRVDGITTMRMVNAAPDIRSIDVYFNGVLFVDNLETTRATGRVQLTSGVYTAEVLPAGTDYASTTPLDSTEFNANEDEDITLILAGTADDADIIRLRQEFTPTAPDEARVTLVHALPGVAEVSVQSSAISEDEEIENLRYTQASEPLSVNIGAQQFSWGDEETGLSVEIAEDMQFVAGFNYLYILTGRSDSPLIFGDSIGIDENRQSGIQQPPTPIPERPVALRIVNMVASREPLDLFMDETALVTAIPHAQATLEILTAPGLYSVSVFPANSTTSNPEAAYINLGLELRQGGSYTFYILGDTAESAEITVLENRPTSDQGVTLRLGNITTLTGTNFGLAIQDASLSISQPPIDPTAEAQLDPNRQPLIGFSRTIFSRIINSVFSPVEAVEAGSYNLIVIDYDNESAAKYEYDTLLEAGVHYDILVEEIAGNAVNLFVIAYP